MMTIKLRLILSLLPDNQFGYSQMLVFNIVDFKQILIHLLIHTIILHCMVKISIQYDILRYLYVGSQEAPNLANPTNMLLRRGNLAHLHTTYTCFSNTPLLLCHLLPRLASFLSSPSSVSLFLFTTIILHLVYCQ
jgi:uncharacterized membrane protein (UPF0182 family)